MDSSLLWLFMFLLAIVSSGLPFAYSMLVGPQVLGIFGVLLVFMFLGTLGFGALLQSKNCDGVKDMKRVAQNAGIAMGTMAAFLLVPLLKVPWLHNMASAVMVKSTVPATAIDKNSRTQSGGSLQDPMPIDMGFWAFWGGLYGFAIGGTLAATC